MRSSYEFHVIVDFWVGGLNCFGWIFFLDGWYGWSCLPGLWERMCDRKRAHPPPLGMLNQEVGQGKQDFPSHPRRDLLTLSSFNRSPHLNENSGSFCKAKFNTFIIWKRRCLVYKFCCVLLCSDKHYAGYVSNSTYVSRHQKPKLTLSICSRLCCFIIHLTDWLSLW